MTKRKCIVCKNYFEKTEEYKNKCKPCADKKRTEILLKSRCKGNTRSIETRIKEMRVNILGEETI